MKIPVVAYICCYNEADIIAAVVKHLIWNDVQVVALDNGSNDGTYEILERLPLLRLLRLASSGYAWQHLLATVENVACGINSEWSVHHDADEIRYGPWPELNLRQSFERVRREGFTAVDHRVRNYPPVDNDYSGNDPESYFRGYYSTCGYDNDKHIKAWATIRSPSVNLANSAGHEVNFPGRVIYPEKFLIKHYPIRSQQHGERKVLQDRIPRFLSSERQKGWHTQYNHIGLGHNFLADPKDLIYE